MIANENDTTVLMFIEREKSIIPVSLTAFQVAQDSEKKLNESYAGAIIISREGGVSRIKRIEITGYWGKSLYRKILGALSGTYDIRTTFKQEGQMGLEKFKEMVVQYLKHDADRGDPYLPQIASLDTVFQRVNAAKSFSEVFEEINFPQQEDCLDVL